MKKTLCSLILILSACLFAAAQTKPTKQETIDWIIAKLREQSRYEGSEKVDGTALNWNYNYTVQDHIVDVKYRIWGDNERGNFSFDLDDICKAEFNTSSSLHWITLTLKKSVPVVVNAGGRNSTTVYIYLGYDDLQKRFIKALTALAEYNCPKAKDVY